MNLEIIRKFGEWQEKLYLETGDSDGLIGFESEDGKMIINPFKSECFRYDVNPIKYYGKEKIQEFWEQIISKK